MKTLAPSEIPEDFTYYRSGSRFFYEYYQQYVDAQIHLLFPDSYQFLRSSKQLGFYTVVAEKIDREPTLQEIHQWGCTHGIVLWMPLRRREKPDGWIRLPSFFAGLLLHSSRSAFSTLDDPEYWKKWSPSARGHRRNALKLIQSGRLKILSHVDPEYWLSVYESTHVPDPNKSYRLRLCRRAFAQSMQGIRLYLALVDGIPLAGACFIDEGVTSEYFTSFYSRDSKPYHLGVALMDRWFADSRALGMKYCDLDHMRDRGQSSGYSGYTQFKSSIAEYDVFFTEVWIRFFSQKSS